MRTRSPLNNLSEAIKQNRQSASRYSETLRRNEAATRAVLIDPILRALGWDSADTDMVKVEKAMDMTRVDYALYDPKRGVALVVEAKPLGTNLEDKSITMNLVKYAYLYKTTKIMLTDGLVWQIITVSSPGNMAVDAVSFEQDSAVDCASFLVQHLDATRFWGEEPTIDDLAERLARLEVAANALARRFEQPPQHTAPVPAVDGPAVASTAPPVDMPTTPPPNLGPNKTDWKERHYKRFKFWTSLLERSRLRTKLFANIHPGPGSWIAIGAGRSGCNFNYTVSNNGADVDLYIDSDHSLSGEKNKVIFDTLRSEKDAIEAEVGTPLLWLRYDDKRASRIVRRFDDGGLDTPEKWPALQDAMINTMIRFEKAIRPRLAKIQV